RGIAAARVPQAGLADALEAAGPEPHRLLPGEVRHALPPVHDGPADGIGAKPGAQFLLSENAFQRDGLAPTLDGVEVPDGPQEIETAILGTNDLSILNCWIDAAVVANFRGRAWACTC